MQDVVSGGAELKLLKGKFQGKNTERECRKTVGGEGSCRKVKLGFGVSEMSKGATIIMSKEIVAPK
jgi:hypothetical protein